MSVEKITVSRPRKQSYNAIARDFFGTRSNSPSKMLTNNEAQKSRTVKQVLQTEVLQTDVLQTTKYSRPQIVLPTKPPPEILKRARKA